MIEKNIGHPIISAIDIGSNSIHGLIASIDENDHLNEIYRDKASVRLGSGMKEGLLRQDSIDASVKFIENFQSESKKYNAIISAFATSAVREANNKELLINSVKDKTGIDIKIISGTEEAYLIYLGVSKTLSVFDKRALIIDIGGGSTELILAEKGQMRLIDSLKLGAIRTTNEFFENYITPPDRITDCNRYINMLMSDSIKQIKNIGFDIVIGTSGTIQALGRISLSNSGQKAPAFLNDITINSLDLFRIFDDLEKLRKPKNKAKIIGLESSRADIITAGALIFSNFLKELKIPRIIVSSYALREGIIYDTNNKLNILK